MYCKARDIPTDDIRISQNNHIDPENRYNQTFNIKVELPESMPEKHRQGILKAMDRCTVKKVIQTAPEFQIESVDDLDKESGLDSWQDLDQSQATMIVGKDASLEETILKMTAALESLGIKIEIASWRNIVPNVWSVHIRDASSPLCFTNGKGSSKESALCSALGEYMERISCNYFYNDFYLGNDVANRDFVHYPDEKWFSIGHDDALPEGLMDEVMLRAYNADGELRGSHLIDTNSGMKSRGICAQAFTRQSDQKTIYVPVSLVGNLFVSNGMSAGNSQYETRVQCLSEIFERAVKKDIIEQELALPDVPDSVIDRYPSIKAGIRELEDKGYPVLVKDASLGGKYPVMCVTLMNPKTGGVFASFGAHPKFEVALERSLTELLQGRSFEGLNDVPLPTFNSLAVTEPNNFVEHFVDSTGVVSWRFFSSKSDYQFTDWNHEGSTQEEYNYLMGILSELGKEVYIADYDDLGAKACRILVPTYSEIYPVEDLIWDSTTKAIDYRDDILNIHSLSEDQLNRLLERLEDSGLDNYTLISELIGIAFDENTVWGKLDVGELKIMICLALGLCEEAKELVEQFLTFNDNLVGRCLYYQAVNAVLDIALDDGLDIEDYLKSFQKMFGVETMEHVIATINGTKRFYGLTETDLSLKGLDKHIALVESYKKLHTARAKRSQTL